METRGARTRRILLGDEPRALLPFFLPTLLAFAIDLGLRGRDFWVFEPHGKAIYFSSLLISSAFWVFVLLIAARLVNALAGPRRFRARAALALLFVAVIAPIAACGFAGQLLYFRIFRAYAGRDTLRLGALLRGSYRAWFFAWNTATSLALMIAFGLLFAWVMFRIVRKMAPALRGPFPLLPAITFLGALFCFWTDNVDTRFLQASTPDASFLNGATHAFRAATTGAGRVRQGVTLRDPAPLPKLPRERERPPNVILIITESVRADSMCSEPPPRCRARFFDASDVAADRISLGKLTAQTPNTFSASMVLWTGLAPNADFKVAHVAPMLWEIARAAGYRTAYITSQNSKFEDLGIYVYNAGIDVRETSTELGGMAHEQLGAPDERATAAALRFVHDVPADKPYFAVLHLSNTHHPYRIDPALQPFTPHSDDYEDVGAYLNHYKNSLLLQERTVSEFLREVRKTPSWDDTVVVFVSDHAEQFAEHGLVHHNHSLFDVELRIPGFVVAGKRALTDAQRAALATYANARTYSQDVNATVVDLFGVASARSSFAYSDWVQGRSLVRPRANNPDPTVLFATATGVWEPYDAWFGVARQERIVVGARNAPWACYDTARDPREEHAMPGAACADLLAIAKTSFPLAMW